MALVEELYGLYKLILSVNDEDRVKQRKKGDAVRKFGPERTDSLSCVHVHVSHSYDIDPRLHDV